ncbi:hypothetical protein J6590_009255 [Homalodisca vitripennis]|nr:hypothetical protein J6590_009255 [Homalodisca vitripennis]
MFRCILTLATEGRNKNFCQKPTLQHSQKVRWTACKPIWFNWTRFACPVWSSMLDSLGSTCTTTPPPQIPERLLLRSLRGFSVEPTYIKYSGRVSDSPSSCRCGRGT